MLLSYGGQWGWPAATIPQPPNGSRARRLRPFYSRAREVRRSSSTTNSCRGGAHRTCLCAASRGLGRTAPSFRRPFLIPAQARIPEPQNRAKFGDPTVWVVLARFVQKPDLERLGCVPAKWVDGQRPEPVLSVRYNPFRSNTSGVAEGSLSRLEATRGLSPSDLVS